MTFRSAIIEDAELLLSWRNDPLTRQNSIHQNEITLSDHLNWLRSKLTDSHTSIYIALDDHQPVGTVRIDQIGSDQELTELSWTVAPGQRGKGWGKKILLAFSSRLSGKIQARIKKGNHPSKKLAASIGLHYAKEENEVEIWEGEF